MQRLLKIMCVSVVLTLHGCYYDKFENFRPKINCDTAKTVTFTQDIKLILDQNCNSCHASNAPSGSITLDNYSSVKNIALTGKLYSSITWDGTTVMMPKGSPSKIDECSIKAIKKWMDNGYAQ
jgi:hypothetical protein